MSLKITGTGNSWFQSSDNEWQFPSFNHFPSSPRVQGLNNVSRALQTLSLVLLIMEHSASAALYRTCPYYDALPNPTSTSLLSSLHGAQVLITYTRREMTLQNGRAPAPLIGGLRGGWDILNGSQTMVPLGLGVSLSPWQRHHTGRTWRWG